MQNFLTLLAVFAQTAPPPKVGMDYFIFMPFVGIVILIGVIGLFIWKPIVCTRIFAVLAFAAGVAGIVSGICFLTIERGEGASFLLPHEAIWVLGGGSGLLVGGIIALILSFVSRRKKTENA
jgi:hypothetical protein